MDSARRVYKYTIFRLSVGLPTFVHLPVCRDLLDVVVRLESKATWRLCEA